ncbi:MAG: ATP synthase F1 subunit delta [Bacteroidales bacterium]|jgi:F-type H+-transporting ATPase subunit delta|nr:ATP synthase F1 subunit delta [Bacteroidales bacterium]MDI9576279.1 ATP synthase F1 subunit delta [Bacteroidota bacterium]MDD2593928.1 ATP synthase F1 subunit delta [Bacteroidales bacterium]MDD3756256.1 ATP synthase F1 subunit delta [Bacteroidales bacterium]HHW59531.1 ATP synthase F1 subunit delta [Bacteroidales bacterium]
MNVAQRYAKSLLDLAIEQHIAELVYNDLLLINKILNENKDLCIVLQSPIIRNEKKEKIFSEIFAEYIQPLSLNFFTLLLRKSRIVIFKNIVKSYEDFYYEANNILCVNITTAQHFNESLLDKLQSKIHGFFPDKSLKFNENIDEEILGGFVVNFYDYMIDKSIRTKLIQARKQIMRKEYEKKY